MPNLSYVSCEVSRELIENLAKDYAKINKFVAAIQYSCRHGKDIQDAEYFPCVDQTKFRIGILLFHRYVKELWIVSGEELRIEIYEFALNLAKQLPNDRNIHGYLQNFALNIQFE